MDLLFSGESLQQHLLDSPRALAVARLATLLTLIIESLIAVSFLMAFRLPFLRKVRNLALIAFMLMTYPVATVIGFGWLLAIMGYCQCTPDERGAKIAYVLVFCGMQIFMIPWRSVFS